MNREPTARFLAGRHTAHHAVPRRGGAAIEEPAETSRERTIRQQPCAGPRVALITAKEERLAALTDEELRDRTAALRARLVEGAKASGS